MLFTLHCAWIQGAAANPDSEEQQQKLREAAEGLRMATNAAAQNAIKKRLVNKLEVSTYIYISETKSITLISCMTNKPYAASLLKLSQICFWGISFSYVIAFR